MTGLILRLELASWRREPRLLALLCAVVVAVIGATVWATVGDIAQGRSQRAAAEAARAQWEGRGAANPHGMAHFGDFAFRPAGPLARLDRGVQARVGKVLFVEGHRQGVPLHADAHRAGSVARFPRLDAAFVLQTIVPLLLIFVGATGLMADRETGRLKLAMVQGVRARSVLYGRFMALWGLALLLLFTVVATSFITTASLGANANPPLGRLVSFLLAHALFFAVVAAAIISASIWLTSARASLLALLASWITATALLPPATAGVAAVLYGLPSQDAFQAEMRASREEGPDGHNPEDAELERLRQATLKEHGVKTVEELPINFDGLAMQVDEEFGNRVWDEHFGALRETLERQVVVGSAVALLNPFQAIDHVSMALAGTDLAHDLAFQQQAESYRRSLVEALNREHAYGGSKTGDWSWKADAEFFASLRVFAYEPPGPMHALRSRIPESIGLVLWALVLLMVLRSGADRLERGALPC